jgi:hypothetical protein
MVRARTPVLHYRWLHDSPIRRRERGVITDFRIAIAEELAMLDHFRYLGRNHVLPCGVLLLDSFQYVAREDLDHAFIEVIERLDSALPHQVPEQI